jgi:addiction module HigA family antidote
MDRFDPLTPGEILKEEFLEPMNISQSKLSRDLDIPVSRINDIVNGTRAITADTAVRLAEYFGIGADFWLALQSKYEIETLKRSGAYDAIVAHVRKIAVSV